jgi:hypothetical protein
MVKLTLVALAGLAIASQAAVSPALAQDGDMDVEMIVEELTEALALSDEQAQEVTGHLQAFGMAMDEASAKAENEEADGAQMISALKAARSDFQESMQGTLSEEQYAAYEQLMDEVMQEIFESIAELRITDMRYELDLSDEQAAALKPVMGTGIRGLVGVIFEYADRRMGPRIKLQMANKLKSISAETKAGMNEILTPEQQQKYEAWKEAQKSSQEGG